MKQNCNHRPSRNTRRLRRMEDKIDIIMSDLNRIIRIVTTEQAVRRERQEMEIDLAIERLNESAHSLKQVADEELKTMDDIVERMHDNSRRERDEAERDARLLRRIFRSK